MMQDFLEQKFKEEQEMRYGSLYFSVSRSLCKKSRLLCCQQIKAPFWITLSSVTPSVLSVTLCFTSALCVLQNAGDFM